MKKVAIITRTRNRPIMLPRVLTSIKNQTFKNYVWVLVNDAGEKQPIEKIANEAIKFDIEVKVIHREKSIGMEAASNHGIRCSDSKYIVIHDDDDTWENKYLEKTVAYLEKHENASGVITLTNRIDEIIVDDRITIKNICPYNHWIKNIYLCDLAIENRFPPISFLFRRSIYDLVGGFDERLPVLGDWDFNLRILIEGEIHVIPYILSNYHFRLNSDDNCNYGNTVTSGIDKHILYDAIYRNEKLREDIKSGKFGIGALLSIGQMHRRTNHFLDSMQRISNGCRRNFIVSMLGKLLKI